MEKKNIFAKAVRVATVPPAVVTAFILILSLACDDVVKSGVEAWVAILCLGILPVLAYPSQRALPPYRSRGREGQRELAFLFSVIGYTLALILGIVVKAGQAMMLVFGTYFISVVLLTLCNAALKVRASGHMCSVAAPMLLLVHFLDWYAVIPCALLFSLVAWSSIVLKRHTTSEVVLGSVVGGLGYAAAVTLI